MKAYSVIITVIAVVAIILASYFYFQIATVRNDFQSQLTQANDQLTQSQVELQKTQDELSSLRQLVDTGLNNAKNGVAILKDSLDSFLVAGDVKIASLGNTEVAAITTQIQSLANPQDKIAFEQSWSGFLETKLVRDYLGFAKSLVQTIEGNLENIH